MPEQWASIGSEHSVGRAQRTRAVRPRRDVPRGFLPRHDPTHDPRVQARQPRVGPHQRRARLRQIPRPRANDHHGGGCAHHGERSHRQDGRAVADAVVARGADVCYLVPVAFSGEAKDPVSVGDVVVDIKSIRDGDPGAIIKSLKAEHPGLIVVDYTLPAAVNANAALYVANDQPFVMGTTGGDREKLLKDVTDAKLPAVIAPQMGKQVVAFQAAMKLMATNFPGAFKGYTLTVTESHQSSKVDTSGTAKAIVESFNELGCGFDIADAVLVRDVPTQIAPIPTGMGVPEEHILGHAFHTYKLTSPDNTVSFEFQHNVCGRSIYAEGSVDAALFLSDKVGDGCDSEDCEAGKTLFDMIDVLKEGGMVTN